MILLVSCCIRERLNQSLNGKLVANSLRYVCEDAFAKNVLKDFLGRKQSVKLRWRKCVAIYVNLNTSSIALLMQMTVQLSRKRFKRLLNSLQTSPIRYVLSKNFSLCIKISLSNKTVLIVTN